MTDSIEIKILNNVDLNNIDLNTLEALDAAREFVSQTNIFKFSWPSNEEIPFTFNRLQTEMHQLQMANYLADWIIGVDISGFNSITLNKNSASGYLIDFWNDCFETISYKNITSIKISAFRGENISSVCASIDFIINDPCENMYSPLVNFVNLCSLNL